MFGGQSKMVAAAVGAVVVLLLMLTGLQHRARTKFAAPAAVREKHVTPESCAALGLVPKDACPRAAAPTPCPTCAACPAPPPPCPAPPPPCPAPAPCPTCPTCPVCPAPAPAPAPAPGPAFDSSSGPSWWKRPRLRRVHHILRLAKWDCQDKASIVRFLPNSSLVVEVGAFDGSEAVIIAKEESVRKLVSYEPGSAKVGMIKGKIAAAGLEHKIDFRSKAASNYSGKADFFIPTAGGSQQDSLTSVKYLFGNEEKETVEVVRLDQEFDEPIAFLKIDTQGHDDRVIYGAEGIIDKHGIDIIHFEFSPELMKQGGGDPSKLLEWLEDKGYIVFDCEFWEPPKLGQPRDFKSYPGTFADWQYQMGNHGQWTDALAIRL